VESAFTHQLNLFERKRYNERPICFESLAAEAVEAIDQFGIDASRGAFAEAANWKGFDEENLNGLSASQFREVLTPALGKVECNLDRDELKELPFVASTFAEPEMDPDVLERMKMVYVDGVLREAARIVSSPSTHGSASQ
jgi:hypothetical protein